METGFAALGIEAGYGDNHVIDGLDITAELGDLVLVTGPNGAGKSTLLGALAGLLPATFESYRMRGEDCSPQSERHRRITHSVTGEWMWLRDLTLADHLSLAQSKPGICSADEALEEFGLAHLSGRVPSSLSSGQLQRASLASILTRPWDVLFLDEPEQRLDAEYAHKLPQVLRRCLPGRVIFASTHAPELFEGVESKRIVLGGAGAVSEDGIVDSENANSGSAVASEDADLPNAGLDYAHGN